MQNYDPLNWALKIEHDPLVFVPYHSYLAAIRHKPARENELQEVAAPITPAI
jgi:hypothetical protein